MKTQLEARKPVPAFLALLGGAEGFEKPSLLNVCLPWETVSVTHNLVKIRAINLLFSESLAEPLMARVEEWMEVDSLGGTRWVSASAREEGGRECGRECWGGAGLRECVTRALREAPGCWGMVRPTGEVGRRAGRK